MSRKLLFISALSAVALWAGTAVADGDRAVVGAGSEADDLNVGSGTQVNANDWHDMFDVNAGGNQLTGGGQNSNGGDRDSRDVVIIAGETAEVANYALDAIVSDNGITVDGANGSASSTFEFSGKSGFRESFGVTAVSANAGAGASQSVSVNVTSSVDLGNAP